MRLKKELVFLKEAYLYASMCSSDPNTQTGVVIVKKGKIVARGANQPPQGVILTPERRERPMKYSFVEHAERNAVYDAAKKGVKLEGATIYSPWFPCAECARAIIQAGIVEFVGHKDMDDFSAEHVKLGDERAWDDSQSYAAQMFEDAKVVYRSVSGKIGGVSILYRGKVFEP